MWTNLNKYNLESWICPVTVDRLENWNHLPIQKKTLSQLFNLVNNIYCIIKSINIIQRFSKQTLTIQVTINTNYSYRPPIIIGECIRLGIAAPKEMSSQRKMRLAVDVLSARVCVCVWLLWVCECVHSMVNGGHQAIPSDRRLADTAHAIRYPIWVCACECSRVCKWVCVYHLVQHTSTHSVCYIILRILAHLRVVNWRKYASATNNTHTRTTNNKKTFDGDDDDDGDGDRKTSNKAWRNI